MPSDQRNKLTQRKKHHEAPHTASQAMQHAKVQALPLIRAATSTGDVCEAQTKLNALASNLMREQRAEFRTWCEAKAETIAGYLAEDAAEAAELAIIAEYSEPGDEHDYDAEPTLEYTPEYWRHQEPEWDLRDAEA